jgi:hypothetical protein
MTESVQIVVKNGEGTSTGASIHLVQDQGAEITMDGKKQEAAERKKKAGKTITSANTR